MLLIVFPVKRLTGSKFIEFIIFFPPLVKIRVAIIFVVKYFLRCFRCDVNVMESLISNGITCNWNWIASRKCQSFKTCTECLAGWPYYKKEKQTSCKWCANCPTGKCIPTNKDCDDLNKCNIRQISVSDVNQCGERQCPASDCDKCKSIGGCIWTRQVLKTCNIHFSFYY